MPLSKQDDQLMKKYITVSWLVLVKITNKCLGSFVLTLRDCWWFFCSSQRLALLPFFVYIFWERSKSEEITVQKLNLILSICKAMVVSRDDLWKKNWSKLGDGVRVFGKINTIWRCWEVGLCCDIRFYHVWTRVNSLQHTECFNSTWSKVDPVQCLSVAIMQVMAT